MFYFGTKLTLIEYSLCYCCVFYFGTTGRHPGRSPVRIYDLKCGIPRDPQHIYWGYQEIPSIYWGYQQISSIHWGYQEILAIPRDPWHILRVVSDPRDSERSPVIILAKSVIPFDCFLPLFLLLLSLLTCVNSCCYLQQYCFTLHYHTIYFI